MNERLGRVDPTTIDVVRTRVPQAIFSDWDRTIGNVDIALARLYTVAENHGIDIGGVHALYQQSKTDGGSMEPLTIIKAQLAGTLSPAELQQRYVHTNVPSVLYADAAGYVQRIRRAVAPESIVTYGVSTEWQEDYKIAGGGYDGHVQTLPDSLKGPYLETLLSPDGTFDFYVVRNGAITGIVEAETAALVDDKVVSLENAPENVTGWLLRRSNEEVLAAQAGEWPKELTVSTLGQLVMEEGVMMRVDTPVADTPDTMPRGGVQYVPIAYGLAA